MFSVNVLNVAGRTRDMALESSDLFSSRKHSNGFLYECNPSKDVHHPVL